MAFNRKQKLRDNIEAIRTAFILDRENRTATTEERAILQRYCGFGGLKCILNPAKELTDAVRWAKSDLELFAPTVELHRLIRENSKDETEYKRFVDSLKASVLTAFYTPKEITDTIADVLADYSVRPARMLEPSAGVGVFVDSMLRHSPNADVMAFEKDLLTGTILRHLYPDQKMRTCGFEKIERPFNNYFDLAVSNIPFGDIAVFDAEFQRSDSFGRRSAQKTIHNYFFLKGLDAVRDGGIVAFITSQGVLNSTKTSVRNELFSQANLVSAIRLPNNLFTDNAGTEVGSDLIVLQKNLSKKEMSQNDDETTGIAIVKRAIEEPLRQIVANAGGEGSVVVNKVREGKGAFGYNARSDRYEDMLEAGILDPTKVARVALENAASIASMFLTTECVLAEKKEPVPPMPAGGAGMNGMGMM